MDGIDISTIGLRDLRSRLSLVPQDPVVFSGSVRANLDPFNERSDAEIESSLAQSGLTEWVQSLPVQFSFLCFLFLCLLTECAHRKWEFEASERPEISKQRAFL